MKVGEDRSPDTIVLGGDVDFAKLDSGALLQLQRLLRCHLTDAVYIAGKILLIVAGLLILSADRDTDFGVGVADFCDLPHTTISSI